jgi:hypothetical protein
MEVRHFVLGKSNRLATKRVAERVQETHRTFVHQVLYRPGTCGLHPTPVIIAPKVGGVMDSAGKKMMAEMALFWFAVHYV